MAKKTKSDYIFVGFNLPTELYSFLEKELKRTYKTKTEYFRDMLLREREKKTNKTTR